MREFTYTWFIQNFNYCWHDKGECIQSPTFFIEMMQNTSWNLELYPRGRENSNCIALFLRKSDNCNGPENITFICELSIFDAYGEALQSEIIAVNPTIIYVGNIGSSEFYFRTKNIVNRSFAFEVLRVRCKMWMDEEGDDEVLCYAKTLIGIEKISFIKTIENFSSIDPNQKIPFNVTSVSSSKFKISGNVYIKSEPGSEPKFMVEISKVEGQSPDARLIKCQIFKLNSAGIGKKCGVIHNKDLQCGETTLSVPLYLKGSNLLGMLHKCLINDKLTLRFACTISTGIDSHGIEEMHHDLHITPLLKENIQDKHFAQLTLEPISVSYDLGVLYMDQILSDIRIGTANKTFPAHKSVLCARSSVFRTMLTTDMTENANDVVQIDDLDERTMDQFLLFLYTDILEDFQWDNIKKLYNVAVKYDVQRLKDVCISFFLTGCNESNMRDLLILEDRHKDFNLKSVVEKFIFESAKEIFCNREWETFMDTHPLLAVEAMLCYLKTV